MRITVLLLATTAPLTAVTPSATAAQEVALQPRLQWELRADGIFGSARAGQLGIGVNVPAGSYVRVGAAAGIGASSRDGGVGASARLDLTARYLLDPYREIRWGPYAGAGLSTLRDRTGRWNGYLLALVGVEGPAKGAWRTALEVGLGGGFRAGLVLRRARSNGR